MALLDGAGTLDDTGCNLFAYQSLLYGYYEAVAYELSQVQAAIESAPAQLSIYDSAGNPSATGYWLDLIGSFFSVSRTPGDSDSKYATIMAASTTYVKCNNVAMEIALQKVTGQPATVQDAIVYSSPETFNGTWNFDGSITFGGASAITFGGAILFDGSHTFDGGDGPVVYGLFDVQYNYDFSDGADPLYVENVVTNIVQGSRAAGTQPRTIALVDSGSLDFHLLGNPRITVL
jgi:hypothetical protein